MSTLQNNIASLEALITKANALPEAIDITAPLAELNAANGGTAATTIGEAVDNTEAHASSQEALIAQIAEALEGKAAGGGNGENTATCEITIKTDKYSIGAVFCYKGAESYAFVEDFRTATTVNAVCGSTICVIQPGLYNVNISSGELLILNYGMGFVYQVPFAPTTVSINIETD